MSEQEKIKKGLKGIIGWYDANGVLEYLHSQDVVIKVDRELPLPYTPGILRPDGRPMVMARDKDVNEVQQDMLKAGYVAVEPLIKEGE